MPVSFINDRDVEIILNGRQVARLFDANAEETHSAIESVEAEVDGELVTIEEGDVIVVTIHV